MSDEKTLVPLNQLTVTTELQNCCGSLQTAVKKWIMVADMSQVGCGCPGWLLIKKSSWVFPVFLSLNSNLSLQSRLKVYQCVVLFILVLFCFFLELRYQILYPYQSKHIASNMSIRIFHLHVICIIKQHLRHKISHPYNDDKSFRG